MAEPQDITINPDGSVVALDWAETGTAVEPSSGRKGTGEIPGDIYASSEHNWLTREGYRWLRALFSRYPKASELLFASWLPPTGGGVWSTNGVGALEAFLSNDPAGADVVAADLWLDPSGRGAVRLQAQVTKASPHTFPATQDTFVYAPIDVVSPPSITEPELTYLSVTVGDPAPAAPVGTVLVWRVETNGAAVVDQEILLPQIPVLNDVGIMMLSILGDLEVGGTATFGGPAIFNDAVTLNADMTAAVGTQVIANGALIVGGLGSFLCNADADFMNGVILGNNSGDAITINGTSTITADVDFGANTITGAGGTITVSNLNGSTVTGTLIQQTIIGGAPSSVNGAKQYNGTELWLGDGLEARQIRAPRDVYVVSDNTTNGVDDITGASISKTITTSQTVEIVLEGSQAATLAGSDVLLRIDATNGVDVVNILRSGDDDQALKVLPTTVAANDSSPNRLVVRWSPTDDVPVPDNDSWTVKGRHGISGPGGTQVTTSNIKFEMRFV